MVERRMDLAEPLTDHHTARISDIKDLLKEKDVDVDALPHGTIEDLTGWLGLPPAHKHRLLTARGSDRAAFLDSVLRWTILVLQQEVHIKGGFFPN